MSLRRAPLLLLLLTLWCRATFTVQIVPPQGSHDPPTRNCPCAHDKLCEAVTIQHDREVFTFSLAQHGPYTQYDWRQITTVAWNTEPELMCTAHAHGARVVINANIGDESLGMLANATARALWVESRLQETQDGFLDGINFDLEVPIKLGSAVSAQYTALVKEAAEAFHEHIPGSQISVDIPWSPYDVDGRNYDWVGLANVADLLFVMAYDMQSQIWGKCVASANSPYDLVKHGLRQFLALGLPSEKLVLGLPWYGYIYDCELQADVMEPLKAEVCQIPLVPFRGCSCSDAAGRQAPYKDIMKLLSDPTAQPIMRRDEGQGSPWFNVLNDKGGMSQVWFDDPLSLLMKYKLAASLGLRGVGFWFVDALNFDSTDPHVHHQTQEMWDALYAFPGSNATAHQI